MEDDKTTGGGWRKRSGGGAEPEKAGKAPERGKGRSWMPVIQLFMKDKYPPEDLDAAM